MSYNEGLNSNYQNVTAVKTSKSSPTVIPTKVLFDIHIRPALRFINVMAKVEIGRTEPVYQSFLISLLHLDT